MSSFEFLMSKTDRFQTKAIFNKYTALRPCVYRVNIIYYFTRKLPFFHSTFSVNLIFEQYTTERENGNLCVD